MLETAEMKEAGVGDSAVQSACCPVSHRGGREQLLYRLKNDITDSERLIAGQ